MEKAFNIIDYMLHGCRRECTGKLVLSEPLVSISLSFQTLDPEAAELTRSIVLHPTIALRSKCISR